MHRRIRQLGAIASVCAAGALVLSLTPDGSGIEIDGRILLNIEIKSEAVERGVVSKVAAAIRRRGMIDQIVVSSFSPAALQQMHSEAPEVRTAVLYNTKFHEGLDAVEIVNDLNASVFNIKRQRLTKEMRRRCRDHDIPIGIYTVNKQHPWAEAVAVKGGKFIRVGSSDEMKPLINDGTKVVDLGGNMVMPGILDLHSHPFITPWYGAMNLSLKNPGDPEKILEEVKAYAEANPDKAWILAGQWNIGIYPDDAPKKEWLDEIIPDRPAYFLSQSGHSAWVNSKTFELAGITKDTLQTEQIIWDTDPATGEPSGTVREFGQAEVLKALPRTEPGKMVPAIKELSESFGAEAAPMVVTVEGETRRLTGTAAAQYESWRLLLKQIYEAETGFVDTADAVDADPVRIPEPTG